MADPGHAGQQLPLVGPEQVGPDGGDPFEGVDGPVPDGVVVVRNAVEQPVDQLRVRQHLGGDRDGPAQRERVTAGELVEEGGHGAGPAQGRS